MKLDKFSKRILIGIFYYLILFGNNELVDNAFIRTLLTYGILGLPCLFISSMIYHNFKNFKTIKLKKVPLIISMIILIWDIITILVGINIGIQSVKAVIFLVILLLLINIVINIEFDEQDKEQILDHFLMASFISMILGILQYFTGYKLNTFDNSKYPGILGRINSTFFIATLYDKFLVLSGIITGYKILKEKFNYKYLFLFFVNSLTIVLTFSRSGIIVYLFLMIVFIFLSLLKKCYRNVIVILISLVCMFFIPGFNSVAQSGLNFIYSKIPVPNFFKISLVSKENNATEEEKIKDLDEKIQNDFSLSFRDYYKLVGKQFVIENKVFGIGYGNYSYLYNNQNAGDYLKDKSVLREYKYMYPHSSFVQVAAESGIVGAVILYGFIVILAIYIVNTKNFINICVVGSFIIAFFLGSYTEGLFNAKQYILIYMLLYSIMCNKDTIVSNKKKKVSFLCLHLGFGGIESSTINTCNALNKNYEVEIVSFYHLTKNQEFKIDDKIKIIHLYNGEPNRETFLNDLRNHQYLKVLMEGIKAINILIKKKLLLVDYIIKSDAKIIVSTRYEFSRLLSKYGNDETIKIAQEHHHHNNDKKYINVLKRDYMNIDYLFALTSTLKKDYEKFLVNNKKTKVVLVPNMVDKISNEVAYLSLKNLIYVGRFHIGKRVDEIIEIFSKIKNKDSKLFLIGDGEERDKLQNLAKELNVSDRVVFTGYLEKNEIANYLLKSSIFLMTSVSEGLPMVLLEAMNYGVPCIAYETDSGVEDIINDQKNGYVVKNRNENEFIMDINKLLSNDKLRKHMGVEAKKTVRNFSSSKVIKIWEKIFDKIFKSISN